MSRPILMRPSETGGAPIDVGQTRPFNHDEMEAIGAVFQHFAYVTEATTAL